MAKFDNPFTGSSSFVDLGPFIFNGVHHDLYALLDKLPYEVSFGARYGNEGAQYYSGMAFKDEFGEWQFIGAFETAIAAVRFFANKHDMLTLRTF